MPTEPNASEKKGKGGIIVLAIVLILLLAVVAVLVFDIGDVRSQHIMGFMRDMPLIGSFFPEPEEEDPLEEMTEEEMRTQLHLYRDQIAGLRTTISEKDAQIAMLNARIEHLSLFETSWQQYRIASANFVDMLARNAPIEFVEFFKDIVDYSLVPQDILGIAYARAQAITEYEENLRDRVSASNAMEAGNVALYLEHLLTTNQPIAIRLLQAMGNTRVGEIFDEMEPEIVARFVTLLSVEPPTFGELVAPQYLPEIAPFEMPTITPAPIDNEPTEEEPEEENLEESEPEEETE